MDCPYYQPPRYVVYKRNSIEYDYEGIAKCSLDGQWCLIEEELECGTYELLREEQDEKPVS